MGLKSIFKRNKQETSLTGGDLQRCKISFNIAEENVALVHNNMISENVKTDKKYYIKLTPYRITIPNNILPVYDFEKNNIAMYIAPDYQGTKMKTVLSTITRPFKGNYTYKFPFYLDRLNYGEGFALTDLYLVRSCCSGIFAEPDTKQGTPTTKYIIKCSDNENDFEIYFVFYATDFPTNIIKALLDPFWVTM